MLPNAHELYQGYNEVVMLRRMDEAEKVKALEVSVLAVAVQAEQFVSADPTGGHDIWPTGATAR